MLSDNPVYATLPTADMATLRRFYEDVSGSPTWVSVGRPGCATRTAT